MSATYVSLEAFEAMVENAMPAFVTAEGIYFQGRLYSCDTLRSGRTHDESDQLPAPMIGERVRVYPDPAWPFGGGGLMVLLMSGEYLCCAHQVTREGLPVLNAEEMALLWEMHETWEPEDVC